MERQKRKQQKLRDRQKRKEEEKKDDPKAKPFSAPPPTLLSLAFNLFNGV